MCTNGQCACPQGTVDCAGFCVSTQTDRTNCGGCGITCPNGQNCANGACRSFTISRTLLDASGDTLRKARNGND